jgi:hypothetical protein
VFGGVKGRQIPAQAGTYKHHLLIVGSVVNDSKLAADSQIPEVGREVQRFQPDSNTVQFFDKKARFAGVRAGGKTM